jgi:hypothetical protein
LMLLILMKNQYLGFTNIFCNITILRQFKVHQ